MTQTHKVRVFPGVYTDKWKLSKAPTLEITTIIPLKGCVVDCVFCPQRTLESRYKGETTLSVDGFKKLIDKVPKEIRITFAGFTEPWMNKYCTDMVLYAHEQGHPVSIFTTGIGMSVEDMQRIKHIPFAPNPNGGFILHLPDQGRLAKHPITNGYIKLLEYIKSIEHEIVNFGTMSMGQEMHEDIKHIYPTAPVHEMWGRAGNLLGEALLKPELNNLKDGYKTVFHGNQDMTCSCDERLYHNVLLPNGDVSLCCMDYGLENILGNLYNQSYEEIIPQPYSTFKICRSCENGIKVDSDIIKFERSFIK